MCNMMPQEPPWEPDGKCSLQKGFTERTVGKESTWNAGDLGLIPGSGRSSGEGIGYPLQYSWASLVDQLVKNPTCNAGELGSPALQTDSSPPELPGKLLGKTFSLSLGQTGCQT